MDRAWINHESVNTTHISLHSPHSLAWLSFSGFWIGSGGAKGRDRVSDPALRADLRAALRPGCGLLVRFPEKNMESPVRFGSVRFRSGLVPVPAVRFYRFFKFFFGIF